MLTAKGVEIRGCAETQALVKDVRAASEEDYATEFLAPIISVKVVAGLDEAIAHINRYGSHHTETIVSENYSKAMRFSARSRFGVGHGQCLDTLCRWL